MSDNKSRDIFYGIVAVATLIVALVGATLAYFSITAGSSEGAIGAQAAVVSIEYNDSQQVTAQADKLIPSAFSVVKQAYQENSADFGDEAALRTNICVDAVGQQVCSIYRFTVRSDVARDFTATLNTEYNGFTYLAYAVRDVTNNAWLNLDNSEGVTETLALSTCSNLNEETTDDCYTTSGSEKTYSVTPKAINSIFGYSLQGSNLVVNSKNIASAVQTYDLVLFIKENNNNQNIDQGQTYQGTIIVETTNAGDSGIITGRSS